jgi:molybdopterin converting factor small subunit
MSEIKITVRLFGAFRKYGDSMDMVCPSGSTVGYIKEQISTLVDESDKSLVFESAIANDQQIIKADTIFEESSKLSILPPVCGG